MLYVICYKLNSISFTSNKEPFKVFLTNTQIKKLEVAKKLKKKVDLKFSKTQFKKTLPYVTSINHSLITQRAKDQLEILKTENAKKAKKSKKLNLQDRLETLKTENAKKAKKLKSLKTKQGKINFDTFTKNTLKKYNETKPKKKSIWEVIEFPKANLI